MPVFGKASKPQTGITALFNRSLTTVGAQVVTYDLFPVWPEGLCATAIMFITATNSTRTGVYGGQRAGSCTRPVGGALVAIVAAPYNGNTGLAVPAPALAAVGNILRLTITGLAGQTIRWRITTQLYNNQ